MSMLMREIGKINRCAMYYREQALKGTGLSGCHLGFVFNICKHPGITQEQLAKKIYIDKSRVTRQIAFLEENGFVLREQSETDKRSRAVYPTDKMLDLYPKVCSVAYEWRKYLTEELREEEITFFESILERVSKKAQLYVDKKEAEK